MADTPDTSASKPYGNVWAVDEGANMFIKFDVGAPWGMCTTLGPTQYVYSGDSNGKIYKLDMAGKLVGWAQTGLGLGQASCLVHQLVCESEKVLIKGDCSTWKVERITFK